ncbi:bifunctional 2-polyprenyl-6-hydroxyphenol methylase/3-demethylubiquinol 3-O-methyltransferase UbiG [Bacteriovorax sp. Seq25_V]|uniref:class I SAM-dependent methyltransferase n=1 Tax=Bacteriovorax sp. Seq25_V TaxID=1201288 RepID=UPI00038A00D1|nr:class I SAM-dependent methyltransferase [Bacteriovorax sp. Seq25_V]EQC44698.1 methionine biosynthesis protein MetW-like protein [Bacteriovorax sp. Seq25_V]
MFNKFFICLLLISSSFARENISGSRFELLTGARRTGETKGFWDKKFAQNNYVYGKAPAKFLAKNYDFIPNGSRVLDIGMGEGRNAVFLATKGYKVTGIDISNVAIKKARMLAREFGVRIDTVHKSVNDYDVPNGSIDAIICFYYVDREIVKKLMDWLKPGGVLVFEGYTLKEKEMNGMKEKDSYLLKNDELLTLFPKFNILKYEQPLHRSEFTASIIVQKPKE